MARKGRWRNRIHSPYAIATLTGSLRGDALQSKLQGSSGSVHAGRKLDIQRFNGKFAGD
ncbi:MAG: hypothetical protein JWN23_2699 [Rhodocyclales bacterium]|nr:hypothetical protein [Rhodocyclales bacterium]